MMTFEAKFCSSTDANTFALSTKGQPIEVKSQVPISMTWSITNFSPTSKSSFSTSTVSSLKTLCYFPDNLIIAKVSYSAEGYSTVCFFV